jgi:predicted nucleic acid-binding protein
VSDAPPVPKETLLSSLHERNTSSPIAGADENGVFLEPFFSSWLGDALPVVLDANILRHEIGRTCRTGKRTILVTGANTRAFRLYCADHVLEEVDKHGPAWAAAMKIDAAAFVGVWDKTYLPLIRRVPSMGLEHLLMAHEREQIKSLRSVDSDDVPSATLALAMGALFLTKDNAAYEAVYAKPATAETREGWLEPLRSGGDSAELQQLITMASAIPTLTSAGVWHSVRWIHARSPIGVVAAGLVTAALLFSIPGSAYRRACDGIKVGASRLHDEIFQPYYEAMARVRGALPPFPPWDDLVDGTTRNAALTRACLYRLVRSRGTPLRASEVASKLPFLGIGQAAPSVGKVLRGDPCFFEPYKGRWQVGRPAKAFEPIMLVAHWDHRHSLPVPEGLDKLRGTLRDAGEILGAM